MATTEKYGLYLEDDATTKFRAWREKMNGSNDSNMVKIDTILGEKADSSKCRTFTLLASAWAGVNPPFTQEVAVDGLAAEQNGEIGIALNATVEERSMARIAQLCLTGQEDGKLVVSADGELPTIDIPIMLILLG